MWIPLFPAALTEKIDPNFLQSMYEKEMGEN